MTDDFRRRGLIEHERFEDDRQAFARYKQLRRQEREYV
jgi:hypothetical protein